MGLDFYEKPEIATDLHQPTSCHSPLPALTAHGCNDIMNEITYAYEIMFVEGLPAEA